MVKNRKIDKIRELSITKRLNFLIGSGLSIPDIPSMNNEDYKDENGVFSSELLTNKVVEVSNQVLNGDDGIKEKLTEYKNFLESIISLLNISNSRQVPKSVNIFSTNYDLFIEKAMDEIMHSSLKLIFNDGSNGYFNRFLDSYNFDKTSAYRGQFDRYTDEIPSISLIKPHGSVNWSKYDENQILIKNKVMNNPFVVKPDGHEAANTFEEKHFFAMLRLFQQELDKEESILIVYGFSFGDDHIKRMVTRALQNPSLNIYYFIHENGNEDELKKNLGDSAFNSPQFNLIYPNDLDIKKIYLNDVTNVLKGI